MTGGFASTFIAFVEHPANPASKKGRHVARYVFILMDEIQAQGAFQGG
jgi:hypothetical protein